MNLFSGPAVAALLGGAVLLALVWTGLHWYHRAAEEKKRADGEVLLSGQYAQTIRDMQQRQREVAAINVRQIKELADANLSIENLRADVAAGHRQLRVKARCPSVPASSAPSGVDDAAPPRLEDAAVPDYFTLVSRVTLMEHQLKGLQAYWRGAGEISISCARRRRQGDNDEWFIQSSQACFFTAAAAADGFHYTGSAAMRNGAD